MIDRPVPAPQRPQLRIWYRLLQLSHFEIMQFHFLIFLFQLQLHDLVLPLDFHIPLIVQVAIVSKLFLDRVLLGLQHFYVPFKHDVLLFKILIFVSQCFEFLVIVLRLLYTSLLLLYYHGKSFGLFLHAQYFIVSVNLRLLFDLQLVHEIAHRAVGLRNCCAKAINFLSELVCFGQALRHFRVALLQTPLHGIVLIIYLPELPVPALDLIFELDDLIDLVLVLEQVPHILYLFGQLVVLLLSLLQFVVLCLQLFEQLLFSRSLCSLLFLDSDELRFHLLDDGCQLGLEAIIDRSNLLNVGVRDFILVICE